MIDPNEAAKKKEQQKANSDLNSSILKKLNRKSQTRKAAVVMDDEPDDIDTKGELTTATDQASINNVVDELNNMMLGSGKEEQHE